MTRPVSGKLKAASRPALKNPLRASTMPLLASASASPGIGGTPAPAEPAAGEVSAEQLRRMQVSEFCAWLRTQTNKHKRPFQEETIRGYAETARALGHWMGEQEIDGDFTACDVEMLNQFFAGYRNSHTQGGTNTRQRNLHHLFKWLALRYDHPDPWTSDLVRYGPVKSRPSTLAQEFIRDLLAVTGGGRATSFADIRDHAMIRMLTEGVRREELAQQQVTDLSEDLITRPFVRVVPLKGARDFSAGRLVPLMMTSAQALSAYLRVRRSHRQARLPALWLGSRNRGPITGSGVYQMLDRRAEEAGYDPHAVHPHMFRHTFANDWLASGGSEGDLMRLMGWQDRSMVDRYAADMQDQRAFDAKRRRGDMY
jgi:site-specific recombinase XerD